MIYETWTGVNQKHAIGLIGSCKPIKIKAKSPKEAAGLAAKLFSTKNYSEDITVVCVRTKTKTVCYEAKLTFTVKEIHAK